MSPLIRKEIRLLLPAWIGAMLLAIVPAWVAGTAWNLNDSGDDYFQSQAGFWLEGIVPVIFALGILLLGLSPFGQEFSQGTFTVLLSQPAERSRIWRTKISILSFAFLTVWLAAIVSIWCQYYLYDRFHALDSLHPLRYLYFNKHYLQFSGAFDNSCVFLTLSALVVSSGGLWTTLLLRQITNAFWFTLLTPLAIIFGTMSLLSNRIASDQSTSIYIVVALAVYSVAGFFAAAILFRRCQDIQGGGGEISLPKFKKVSGLGTAAISFRPRHRFSALCWKELQLHQMNILIAALVLLLHLSSFLVRKIHPQFSNPDIQAVLEMIWLLWLLMPILIGSSAIADERRFGIMESQLSLPVSRRVQLLIKFSIGLVFSLLLGAAIPLLVEGTKELNYWLFLIVAALFFVSFYASSLARTVLQAMVLAIIVGVALFFGEIITIINVSISLFQHRYDYQFGFNFLKVFLGLPILLLVLIWLIFWNYQQLRQNTSLLLVNLLTMAAAFAGILLLSYAIYFRAWEYVTPTLPLRGFMRLSPATEVKLAGSPGAIYAVLPDGRLSAQTHIYRPLLNGFMVSARGNSSFMPGTNWTEAAADSFQAVGIRSDGSLWNIQRPWDASHRRFEPKGAVRLAQIGSDTDWSQAAGGSLGFLLLKKNGSLWVWGTHGLDWGRDLDRFQKSLTNKLRLDLAMSPTRLGDETNWIQLYSSDVSAYAMKDNGDVWSWMDWIGTNHVSQFYIHDTAKGPWLSFMPFQDRQYIGVKTNGTLWVTRLAPLSPGDWEYRPFQLARDAEWKSAIFLNQDEFIAIRSDGTLWEWNPAHVVEPSRIQLPFQPVQLGTHSDWIALSPGGLALAADGSLWAWDRPSWHVWMAPSRKPTYMGNIFEGSTTSP